MPVQDFPFPPRGDKSAIEEGLTFSPKFDADGLIACVTCEAGSNEVLMVAWMNAEALQLTIETGVAHYWSRSRKSLWRKGDTSGQTQTVKDIRTDCDQDAILLSVEAGGDGGACHTGRKSCFYRRIVQRDGSTKLVMIDADTAS
ncbi:MAG: phosphoribosyl-AMP cyclohydrolase [Beijerinckiaceae bacterium]